MNLSNEFWKRSESIHPEDVTPGKMGVGIDLDRRVIVFFTGEEFVELDPDMAMAVSATLLMASDALREHIAKTN